jgi:uncharacterized protein DUF1569
MGAAHFDHDYVDEIIERLGKLAPDTKPEWGSMTPEDLLRHLNSVFRYGLGQGPDLPDRSNWKRRNIIRPLLLYGIVKIPRNVPLPRQAREAVLKGPAVELETLHATLKEYLSAAETGALKPRRHPLLGDLGVDGWARFHYRHCEHHLGQFGV